MKLTLTALSFAVIVLATAALVPAQRAGALTTDQELADNLMDEVEAVLSEAPTDGRFGVRRIDFVVHSRSFRDRVGNQKGAAAYEALNKRQAFWIITFGQIGSTGPAKRVRRADQPAIAGRTRLGGVDSLAAYERTILDLKGKAADLARSGKKTIKESGYILFPPNRSIIEARVIRAKAECLSCHTDVKAGGAVGVAAIVRSARG